MDISKFLDIDDNTKDMISVVGGGGKTTTIFSLASELKRLNKRILVTTTTAIYNPDTDLYDSLVVLDNKQSIETNWTNGTITVLGSCISTENKLLGVDCSILNEIYRKKLFDFILIEADGSKKRPIKAPASHEPVIPSATSKVLGVIGMDSLGKTIDDANVHRPAILSEVTNSRIGDSITKEIIYRLVVSKKGLFKDTPKNSKKYLLLNKVDHQQDMYYANIIGNMIRKDNFVINGILAGSVATKQIVSI